MPANRITFCRSLLAGDSERPPTVPVLHRRQAGSYIPTKLSARFTIKNSQRHAPASGIPWASAFRTLPSTAARADCAATTSQLRRIMTMATFT